MNRFSTVQVVFFSNSLIFVLFCGVRARNYYLRGELAFYILFFLIVRSNRNNTCIFLFRIIRIWVRGILEPYASDHKEQVQHRLGLSYFIYSLNFFVFFCGPSRNLLFTSGTGLYYIFFEVSTTQEMFFCKYLYALVEQRKYSSYFFICCLYHNLGQKMLFFFIKSLFSLPSFSSCPSPPPLSSFLKTFVRLKPGNNSHI